MDAPPVVDHLVLASVHLDQGVRWVADRLGVAPVPGGRHPGFGTRNALLGLRGPYLEVLSLDPEQKGTSSRLVELVGGRAVPALVTLAVRKSGLDDPLPMSRLRPDGSVLSWQVQFTATPLFFIDWLGGSPPSALPDGGRITSLSVTTPQPDDLVGVPNVEVRDGPWRIEAYVEGKRLG